MSLIEEGFIIKDEDASCGEDAEMDEEKQQRNQRMKVLEQRKKAMLQQGAQIRPIVILQPDISSEYTAVTLSKGVHFPLSLAKPAKVEVE
jgi:hypothetical protein